MRNPGSFTTEHGAPDTTGGESTDQADPLARVSTATLIERLLLPQHVELRAALHYLRGLAAGLAPDDPSRSRIMRRASTMIDELSEVMLDHFEHEERAIFPALSAGVAPVHDLADIHDHHGDIDARLLRLRALTAELRSGAEVTENTVILFEGLTSFDELARHHHDLEQTALLARYA